MKYGKIYGARTTPRRGPEPAAGQQAKAAKGGSWQIDDWQRLNRFLILGSESASYYASDQKPAIENAEAVRRCIEADGARVVGEIVAISDAGRAPRNDPALFALAMCAGLGSAFTRRAALDALPELARLGAHLIHFARYAHGFRGWGRGLRQAVAAWYARIPAGALASELVNHAGCDGWSHRDLLRLAHPKTSEPVRNAIYHWAVDGWDSVGESPTRTRPSAFSGHLSGCSARRVRRPRAGYWWTTAFRWRRCRWRCAGARYGKRSCREPA